VYDTKEHSHVFADPLSGKPWQMIWLRGGPSLSQHDRTHLGRLIVMMNYKDVAEEDFKGDSSEGRVTTKSKISGMGHFYGQVYDLHLETDDRTVDACIILIDTKSRRAAKGILN